MCYHKQINYSAIKLINQDKSACASKSNITSWSNCWSNKLVRPPYRQWAWASETNKYDNDLATQSVKRKQDTWHCWHSCHKSTGAPVQLPLCIQCQLQHNKKEKMTKLATPLQQILNTDIINEVLQFLFSFYPRDAMLARVIAIATCLSVCLSVCPSVMRRYCVKTKKASVMISSPSGSPKTLVFWRQIWSPNSKGFPPNGGLKQGSVGKIHNCRAVAWRPYMLRRQTATF